MIALSSFVEGSKESKSVAHTNSVRHIFVIDTGVPILRIRIKGDLNIIIIIIHIIIHFVVVVICLQHDESHYITVISYNLYRGHR
jgi:hypothetical protein